ncbi:MAG: DNA polymerase III subunit chi [Rickettsiaceae bacterium]
MFNLKIYKAPEQLIYKISCLLIEKAYQSKHTILVLLDGVDNVSMLDKMLWTYKKHAFIPHDSENNEYAKDQPIFITDVLINPNLAKTIIIIGEHSLLQSENDHLVEFEQILLILPDNDNDQILKKITQKSQKVEYFTYSIKDKCWKENT